jgi:hypothetical protein
MPWKETSPMNEPVKFVAAMLEAKETFGELCERFGISRKQGYKWKERYQSGGVRARENRSRAPHSAGGREAPAPASRVAVGEHRRRAPSVRSRKGRG